ncbi:hypothetical protein J4457_02360, partial [Candidatus Woesearchaeota archaeon]|nr:hypothetical protein [Candidatus Woesearchaeota archaeon]
DVIYDYFPKKEVKTLYGVIYLDPDRKLEEGIFTLRYVNSQGQVRDLVFAESGKEEGIEKHINKEYSELLSLDATPHVLGKFGNYTVLDTRLSFVTHDVTVQDGPYALRYIERDPFLLLPPSHCKDFYEKTKVLEPVEVHLAGKTFLFYTDNKLEREHALDIVDRIGSMKGTGSITFADCLESMPSDDKIARIYIPGKGYATPLAQLSKMETHDCDSAAKVQFAQLNSAGFPVQVHRVGFVNRSKNILYIWVLP